MHKLHIAQSRRNARLFLQSSNWDPTTPSPADECPPPLVPGWGYILAYGRGGGVSQFGRGTDTVVIQVPCGYMYSCKFYCPREPNLKIFFIWSPQVELNGAGGSVLLYSILQCKEKRGLKSILKIHRVWKQKQGVRGKCA